MINPTVSEKAKRPRLGREAHGGSEVRENPVGLRWLAPTLSYIDRHSHVKDRENDFVPLFISLA